MATAADFPVERYVTIDGQEFYIRRNGQGPQTYLVVVGNAPGPKPLRYSLGTINLATGKISVWVPAGYKPRALTRAYTEARLEAIRSHFGLGMKAQRASGRHESLRDHWWVSFTSGHANPQRFAVPVASLKLANEWATKFRGFGDRRNVRVARNRPTGATILSEHEELNAASGRRAQRVSGHVESQTYRYAAVEQARNRMHRQARDTGRPTVVLLVNGYYVVVPAENWHPRTKRYGGFPATLIAKSASAK